MAIETWCRLVEVECRPEGSWGAFRRNGSYGTLSRTAKLRAQYTLNGFSCGNSAKSIDIMSLLVFIMEELSRYSSLFIVMCTVAGDIQRPVPQLLVYADDVSLVFENKASFDRLAIWSSITTQ